MRASIMGVKVDGVTLHQAVEQVAGFIRRGTPHQVVTLNAEMAYLAWQDRQLCQAINNAALVVPDGIGVVWASQRLGTPVPGRVAGIDLMLALVERAASEGWEIYLYGGAPGVAAEAAGQLQRQYPQLRVAGTAHGYLTVAEESELRDDIHRAAPRLLLVALGAPRQELWLQRYLPQLGGIVGMGVGGSFDVVAGRVRRAPRWVQRLGLEWLLRVLWQPSRLRRSMVLPLFAWQVWRSGGRRT